MRIAKYFANTEITRTFEECGDVLTVENLAALFGKNKDTIRRWCRTGTLPAARIEKQYFVLKKDFIELFERNGKNGKTW